MSQSQSTNKSRKLLFAFGILLYRLGLARSVIALSPNRVRAMLYHTVEPETNNWTEGLNVNVTPQEFAANLDYFQEYYNVVDVMDVVRGELAPRPLVITFDDGYQSVATHAAPALIERSMPATVYLVSRAVNGELVWVNLLNRALQCAPEETLAIAHTMPELSDVGSHHELLAHVQEECQPATVDALCEKILAQMSAHALYPEAALYMNRETIFALQKQNIHFGFHTRDHFNMSLCSRKDVAKQLDASDIAECLDSESFAYPFGYFNEHAITGVEAKGYKRIMTVGNNNHRFNGLHMDRIEVFTANPAHVFAHIEVVEPIIAIVRRVVLTVKGNYNVPASSPESAPSSTARAP